MKKIVYTILSVLLILPFAVKADMSGPMIREYDMEVINPDGAQLYDYVEEGEDYVLKPTDKKLPYGTRFTVNDDYDDEEYVSAAVGYDEDTDTYEYEGYVSKKECRSIVKDFKITEKELSKKYDIIVVQDIEIKKGPSYGYAGTGVKIKKGTKLTARKILVYDEEDKSYYEDEMDPWLYVEYNKTKGYIIAYEGTIGFDIGKVKALTITDIGMYNKYEDEKPFATIPANTVINAQTYEMDEWARGYYVEYNGKKGIVSQSEYIIEGDEIEFTAVKDLKVYEKLDVDDDNNVTAKVVGTIPAGTKGTSKYFWFENWATYFRYENGNVKGWVYIPEYVEDDEDYNSSDLIEIDYPWDDEEEPSEDEETENPEETDDSSNGSDFQPHIIPRRYYPENNSNNILYICLAAVAVISITTIVIIVLINKKKEQKVEPKQEEVKEIQTEEVKEETKEEVKKEKKK